MHNLRNEFHIAVASGTVAIRIDTDEIDDALRALTAECKKYNWELRVFDSLVGTKWYVGDAPKSQAKAAGGGSKTTDILSAIGGPGGGGPPPSIAGALNEFWLEPSQPDEAAPGEVRPVIMVVPNFHLGPERSREPISNLVQHLVRDKVADHKDYPTLKSNLYDPHNIEEDSDTGKFLVALMPHEAKLPPEISPLFRTIVHELPNEDELLEILAGVVPEAEAGEEEDDVLGEEERRQIARFALGLTRLQAEDVFSSSLVRNKGRIDKAYVWKKKSEILNKEGLVTLHEGKERYKDVAGMAGAKDLIKRLLSPSEYDRDDPDVRPKGVLLVGAPGVGKSLIAKAAGNELGLPTLMVHPGNWFGGIVGESEAKTRKGFDIIRAHAPCVAVIDEVEKVMPSSRGHQGDGGVGARMEGTFLTNMNDMQEPVFWAFTANDVRRMHEAFFRAERVDAVFYVPLPNAEDRAAVWKLYGRKYFPKEVQVKKQAVPFPRHVPMDAGEAVGLLKQAKKPSPADWGPRLALTAMGLPPENRESFVGKVAAVNEAVAEAVRNNLVDDEGWSPAEIRACCRQARSLEESVKKSSSRTRPVSVSAAKAIEALEEWAVDAALDANTGELYSPDAADVAEGEEDEVPARKRVSTKKVRRRVRKTND